ncbi:MAG: hypothetical protein HY754_06560 [Nitrospirae bacterium]|nr:hypothetical protein [Nitrospirota bacterium]
MGKGVKISKIWVKKSSSFKAAGRFDIEYYLNMSPTERLETMQLLREMAFKLKAGLRHGKDRKGLRRVIKRVNFIGLNELIKNKRILKRKQDTVDIDILLAAKKRHLY